MSRCSWMAILALGGMVTACDDRCDFVSGGCLEVVVEGSGQYEGLDFQFVDAMENKTVHSTMDSSTFSLPSKFLIQADNIATSSYVGLSVRARGTQDKHYGMVPLSWPDGEHVQATVVVKPRDCVGGWCRENPFPSVNERTVTTSRLTAIWASGPNNVWLTDEYGNVVQFDGEKWKEPTLIERGIPLYGIFGTGPSNIWVVGAKGTIRRYDGKEWLRENSGSTEDLTAVWASDDRNSWAVGTKGTLLHFSGTAWSPAAESGTVTTQDLRNVRGRHVSDVWAVGDGETILHYDGSSWSRATINGIRTDEALLGLWLDSDGNGWSAGVNNTYVQLSRGQWTGVTVIFPVGIGGAVWGNASTSVWAGGCDMNLARYDGAQWNQLLGTPSLLPKSAPLDCKRYQATGMWGVNGRDIWVVGAEGLILRYGYFSD